MPIFRIPDRHLFPDASLADPSGLLGVGGDLDPKRVLLGYRLGIFPWYSVGQPILWWSPDPRTVVEVDKLHVPRSLRKTMRKGEYRVTLDQAFETVIDHCAAAARPGQEGTWITEEMRQAYLSLHEQGHAHSVEAWFDGEVVGGLYGVAVGSLFCGESMFARRADASKVAFVRLVEQLAAWGFPIVDCQVHTSHLERFGAFELPRSEYLARIAGLVKGPGRVGRWSFDIG
jgi:leucyl/phenylalanyl-tRNA---protein transferase